MPSITGALRKLASVFYDWGGSHYNVEHPNYGAIAGKSVTDGAIAAASASFSSATAGFVASDAGKLIMVMGAGAAGAPHITTILAYVNATTVTLNANAATTVTGASSYYGVDNLTALRAAAADLPAGARLFFPRVGPYMVSDYIPFTADDVTVDGVPGATIQWTVLGSFARAGAFVTPMFCGIVADVNGFRVTKNMRLVGPTVAAYAQDNALISCVANSALAVSGIVRAGQVATATTAANHNLKSGYTVRVTGATQPEYNGTFRITVTGPTTFTYTVTGAPATPATGVIVYNPRKRGLYIECELTQSGAYGLFAQFVNNVRGEKTFNAHHLGYAGAMLLSCDNVRFKPGYRVETITPGTGGNMYGVSFSHNSTNYSTDVYAGTPQALNPFCSDYIADAGFLNDIDWEALDSHGGYGGAFINNRIYNTRHGLSLPSGSGGAANYAGSTNRAQGNIIDARRPDGTASGRENLSYGINVGGGSTVPNTGVIVSDNILINKGVVSSGTLGAIIGEYTKGAQYRNNILQKWGGVGVFLGAFADDASVTGNTFQELANPADTAALAIRHTGTTQRLTVGGNMMTANGGTAGRVGLDIVNMTARPTIDPNNFKAATVAEYQFNTSPGRANGAGVPNVEIMAASSATLDLTAVAGGPMIVVLLNVSSGAFTINTITGVRQGGLVLFLNIGTSTVTLSRANLPGAFPGSADIVIPTKATSLILFRATTFYGVPSLTNG